MTNTIVYFEKSGKKNTTETLALARRRAMELGIKKVVMASTHGYTALEGAQVFANTGVELFAVSISPTFDDMGWKMSQEEKERIEKSGVRVITSLHSLADGVSEGFYGESTPGNIVANTLRFFSQGMKVAVEVSIMAMEAGVIPPESEIIAIGGTDEGCDTAIVVKSSFARKIKEFKVCEILCKPRIA
jgi:hypothetical protein